MEIIFLACELGDRGSSKRKETCRDERNGQRSDSIQDHESSPSSVPAAAMPFHPVRSHAAYGELSKKLVFYKGEGEGQDSNLSVVLKSHRHSDYTPLVRE